MTRIIAGKLGGRRLATPPGSTTRPTSERVREAMFSALETRLGGLDGVRVLDLYAGSGALGLEAVSRGAAHATLVEADRRTANVIRRNVRELGVDASVDVVAEKVRSFLRTPAREPYDLIVLDPPYDVPNDEVSAVLTALATPEWLARDGLLVVERSTRDGAFAWPEAVEPFQDRRYGETTLWYGRPHD
ncbi:MULTISPECIES: 16S rRNA (guanine(966)-N(2))-methyltransferase RsmD [Mumia]|uniref:16S rRNA (guanine(966)-N(2))-methyltransferase RsmD n=1 Tax=Mumia TaxID=1546255 RepID=UPI001423F6BA|nr:MULTISPECIES: 16S rRNA (guanine(966)-N(2))-methyltransferase RsmD [unclassified Mumia]QMW67627.1 16S rRNA (guanine(966)-N(2))-methyltransferase RsmD [Mumia sp. ZJ1417]